MKLVVKRFDGLSMIVGDDEIKDFEALAEESEYTVLRLKNGDEVLLAQECDTLRAMLAG